MPFLALALISGICLLAGISYLRFRDVLYPGVLHAAIWGTVLVLYCLSSDSFLPLSAQTLFIFIGGVLVFAMGCYLATWNWKPERRATQHYYLPRSRALDALFWLNLIFLPVSFAYAYTIAGSGPTGSFLVNLRLLETSGDSDRFIWNYFVLLAVVSAGLHLLAVAKENKPTGRLRFMVALVVALGYAILNTGRTWFFLLLIFLTGLGLLSRKLSARKALIYSGMTALLLFTTVAALLGKGADVNKSASENIASLWTAFQTYLLGPLPSFDIVVRHHQTVQLGDNTLRSFWAILDKLGFETHPVALVQEFVNVPYPSNVYTVYRPYVDDCGLFGAVCIHFFLGLLHGGLYRKISRPDPFFYCVFAMSLYPLAMQFFQDQYLSLMSQWLQTVVVLLILTRLARRTVPNGAPTLEAGAVSA